MIFLCSNLNYDFCRLYLALKESFLRCFFAVFFFGKKSLCKEYIFEIEVTLSTLVLSPGETLILPSRRHPSLIVLTWKCLQEVWHQVVPNFNSFFFCLWSCSICWILGGVCWSWGKDFTMFVETLVLKKQGWRGRGWGWGVVRDFEISVFLLFSLLSPLLLIVLAKVKSRTFRNSSNRCWWSFI